MCDTFLSFVKEIKIISLPKYRNVVSSNEKINNINQEKQVGYL